MISLQLVATVVPYGLQGLTQQLSLLKHKGNGLGFNIKVMLL